MRRWSEVETMKAMTILAVAGVALLTAACTTAPRAKFQTDIVLSPGVTKLVLDEGQVNIRQDKRVDCALIKPDATLIPVTYCRTLAEARKTREATQQMLLFQMARGHISH